jgi:penicillin-binding protein 1A
VRFILRFVAVIALFALLLAGGVMALAPQVGDVVTANESTRGDLELRPLAERSIVYDKNGQELATLHAEENRSPVALEDVPDPVVDAVLTIEDADFYDHNGINLQATLRALVENVESGGIEQGGSTITMQVVKNLILTPEQDAERKSRELVLAVQLEQQMSKQEILETYLNTVYLGHGAYGVQAAAEIYWQKSVGELGWAEAALIAALIRNPVGYDPVAFPETAKDRREIVLDELVAAEKITEEEARQFDSVPLPTDTQPVLPPPEDYFVEQVKEQLLRDTRLGETYQERENAVFRGGLQIYTTLDPVAQQQAEAAIASTIPNQPPFTAALIGVEPSSGAVRAMVGGPGFETYQYNITTQYPGRQTGSSFKTFVLLTALEAGYVPTDRIAGGGDFPNPGGEVDPYNIKGSGGTLNSVTLASSNGAYVRLGQIVGLENVVETARRMGVTVPLDPGIISMPLGVFDVPPIEMAGAYASLANLGVRHTPYFVERIEDTDGELVLANTPNPVRSVSRQSACLATQILEANTTGGTGRSAHIGAQPVAGKTGTTEDNGDAWFVGYSPYLTTAVWMGDPAARTPMDNVGGITVQGGTYPARIFSAFMGPYHEGKQVIEFPDCEPTRSGQFIQLGGESEGSDGEGDGGGGTPAGNEAPPPTEAPADDEDDGDDGEDPPVTEAPPTTDAPPVTDPPVTDPPPTTAPPPNQ